MSILLVRHGETDGNARRILQTPETPLNALGIHQAERLAERLAARGVAHVLCSSLLRARMTALPLVQRLGLTLETTPLLEERNFGELRGKLYAELAEDPFAPAFVPPNGESWPVFLARVEQAFRRMVVRRHQLTGPLVVITHGLVCRAMLAQLVPRADGHGSIQRIDNASVTELDETPPHRPRSINCCIHLDLLAAPSSASDGAP